MPTPSISPAKLAANRLNARKSTGPRTPRGKAIAAANSLKHGLFARDLLMPGESSEDLTQLKVDFVRRLNPRDPMELELVERVIAACWKLRRLQRFEAALVQHQCRQWEDDPENDREEHGLGRHQPVPVEVAWQNGSAEFRQQLERLAVQERQLESALRRTLRQLTLLQQADIQAPLTEFAAQTAAAEQGAEQNRQIEAAAAEELNQQAVFEDAQRERALRLTPKPCPVESSENAESEANASGACESNDEELSDAQPSLHATQHATAPGSIWVCERVPKAADAA